MGVLSWRDPVIPRFSAPLAAKLCVRPQKFYRCKNVLEVLYHHAKFGGAQISPAAEEAKTVEFFYWQHCAQRNAPVLNLLRGRFWGFSPAGATHCTDGVKFGTEEVPSSSKFHPIGATIGILDPQNWNFYWNLIEMWSEWASSFLTAHQHIIGHSVP